MKKKIYIFLLAFAQIITAQTNSELIKETINNYIVGSSYNKTDLLESAFTENATLFLSSKDGFKKYNPKEYAGWFKNQKEGEFNGRIGEIITIEIENDIATVKAEILIPEKSWRFVDLFLLKKFEDKWKIISKTATKTNEIKNGKKALFIVSNASYFGNTDLPTGNSFSEIVYAYNTFLKAGINVDFLSPNGGAIPLAYINTSNELMKSHLYNKDFMYALKHTKNPSEINTKDYKAVQFIGGGSAMFGVPENIKIQDIVMNIYEKQKGIISSVCHGTAGIVNLRTSDGKYLVNNKQVSGFPDEYENTNEPYFKTFPFLITETIEKRGGSFKHSIRGKSHVEVDGRLITGQNYNSSKDVSEKVIELLNKE